MAQKPNTKPVNEQLMGFFHDLLTNVEQLAEQARDALTRAFKDIGDALRQHIDALAGAVPASAPTTSSPAGSNDKPKPPQVIDGQLAKLFDGLLGKVEELREQADKAINLPQFRRAFRDLSDSLENQVEELAKAAKKGVDPAEIEAKAKKLAKTFDVKAGDLHEKKGEAQKKQGEASLNTISGQLAAIGGGLSGMAMGLDLVMPGLGTLASTLIELPQKLLEAVTPFVEALNPALLITFNQAVRNLQATIGVAFENVFSSLAPIVNQIGGMLLPMMEALQPVIDQLIDVLTTLMTSAVNQLVAQFKAFLPVLKVVLDLLEALMLIGNLLNVVMRPVVMLFQLLMLGLKPLEAALQVFNKMLEGITEVMEVIMTVFQTAIDVISDFITSLFGGVKLEDMFAQIHKAMKTFVTNLLVLIGQMAKFFGFNSFLDKLIKNLEPKAPQQAAMQGVGIKGFEQIAKDLAVASANAMGTTKETQEDLLKDALEQLKLIQAGDDRTTTLLGIIHTAIQKVIDAMPGKVAVEWLLDAIAHNTKPQKPPAVFRSGFNAIHDAAEAAQRGARQGHG